MATLRFLLPALAILCSARLTQAQVVIVNQPPLFPPPPVFFPPPIFPQPLPVLVPNGVGFRFQRGNLAVGGFWNTGSSLGLVYPAVPTLLIPNGPGPIVPGPIVPGPVLVVPPAYSVLPTYGYMNSRVTVQFITPQVNLVAPPMRPDIAGVDLDVNPPPKIPGFGNMAAREAEKKPALPPLPPAPPRIEKKEEVKPAQPAKKGVNVESFQLVQAGIRAFRDKEMGLAAERFRQAIEINPAGDRAYFLLGQTLIALGKYNEAFDTLAQGLKRHPAWPKEKFTPRIELYGIHIELWQEHNQALEEILKAAPDNPKLLFLLGYNRWFDGQRERALDAFRKAQKFLADPEPANQFLNHV